jgi:hypothetical protein
MVRGSALCGLNTSDSVIRDRGLERIEDDEIGRSGAEHYPKRKDGPRGPS